jgi:hypothetical protein
MQIRDSFESYFSHPRPEVIHVGRLVQPRDKTRSVNFGNILIDIPVKVK